MNCFQTQRHLVRALQAFLMALKAKRVVAREEVKRMAKEMTERMQMVMELTVMMPTAKELKMTRVTAKETTMEKAVQRVVTTTFTVRAVARKGAVAPTVAPALSQMTSSQSHHRSPNLSWPKVVHQLDRLPRRRPSRRCMSASDWSSRRRLLQ